MNLKSFTLSCSFLVLVVVGMFSVGCQKEGATGPAGAAGPQGPAGPAGPKGDTGTANVIYSNWLDVPFDADTVHNGNVIDTVGYSAEITAPKLTSSILSNGEVKVYLNIGTSASPTVVPLPIDALLFGVIVSPIYQVGKITLIASDDVSTFTNASNQKSLQYRYILIPGGTPTGRRATVNWNNYNEVKAYLGLKD